MKIIMKLSAILPLLAISACGGGGGGSDDSSEFRLLTVGDFWTYTQTTVVTGVEGGPITFVHENTVTVVENPVDAAGTVHPGRAFKTEYTQISGPSAPVGTEYELFSQDPATRDVMLRGNITASGAFLPKDGTLYVGSYDVGDTHEYDGDVDSNIITFLGTVVAEETVSVLGSSLDCYVVELEETAESNEQDFHQNGEQVARICPSLGGRAQATMAFDLGAPYAGRMTVDSVLKETNVPL